MAKPFGNMAQLTGDILDSYIMGLQAGSTPDDAGLDEMKYVRVDKLRRYIREGLVTAYTPRENSSTATPSSPQVGDIFMCTGEFTESGVTYQLNHFYVYTTQFTWEDITAGIKGPKGDTGATPLLSVGEVTYGDTPDVTIDTTDPAHPVMNFVLKTSEVGVVDNLTSDSSVDALSAKQGKLLKQDTDTLQSQIVNINSEVDNVEALIGGDAQVENTDPAEGESELSNSRLIHHANLLPNGSFGRVGARSVAWNQLLNKNNFPASTTYNNGNLVYTNNGDGSITLRTTATTTADVTIALESVTSAKGAVSGHTYVFKGGASGVKFGTGNGAGINEEGTGRVAVVTFSSSISMGYLIPSGTTIATAVTLYPLLCDLTAMNMASLTASEFRFKFPASYYPHDEGHIYDLNPSGFRIRGINLWDEEAKNGYYINASTGEEQPADGFFCSANYISVTPNSYLYIVKPTVSTWRVFFYDADKNFVGSTSAVSSAVGRILASNACFVKFWVNDSAYNGGIQFCDDSLPTSVKTTYHASEHQTIETPQLADCHYINEDCYDYVVNVVEDGIVKGKKHTVAGTYTFTGNETVYGGTNGNFNTPVLDGIGKFPSSASVKANIVFEGYVTRTASKVNDMDSPMSVGAYQDTVTFYNPNVTSTAQAKAELAGKTIYFELVTETITDVDPIRSFTVTDYCTIEPVTPQTELVNRIDVPFSVKSVSANTLIEQITQNTADIAEEKATRAAQVSALDKRVTNLELKTGDQFSVDYPSSTYGIDGVPADVEPYAKVTKLKGVTRGVNQQMPIVSSFSRSSNGITFVSDGNGKYSISGLASASSETRVTDALVFPKGHRFLIATTKPMSYGTARIIIWVNNSQAAGVYYGGQSDSASDTAKLFTINDSWFNETIWFNVQNGKNPSISDLQIIIRDLTQYFSSDPSVDVSTLTISDIQTNYPELLIPSDYDAGSLVSTTYSAVKSVGKNLFDETTKFLVNGFTFSGGYWSRTVLSGLFETGISYKSNTQYAFSYKGHCSVSNVNFRFVVNYTDGTSENTTIITSTTDALYTWVSASGKTISSIRTSFGNGGSVYLEYLQIEEGSSATSYSPYMEDTLTLPSPVELKGAGDVAEEYYPETGRVTHPLFEYEIASNVQMDYGTWADNTISIRYQVVASQGKNLGGVISEIWADMEMVAVISGTYIRFKNATSRWASLDAFKADAIGSKILWELATPSADTYVDPLPDNYIKVEPNGTIEAVQSQTTEIDSAMTVEYMAS